jgi:hypothetical protein
MTSHNTPPLNDGLLSTLELSARLHVSPQAVSKMAKAGCPVASREKSAHGRQGMRFDLKAVRLWLVSTGNVSRSMLAAPAVIAGTVETAPAPATDKLPASAAPVEGQSHFTGALDRARRSEEACFAIWAGKLTDPVDAAAHHGRWIAAADALLRLEIAKGKILLAENTMMKTEDAFSATAALLQSIRIDIEALPNATAPRLAGLTVPEIAAVLRQAVQDVLRHIHKGEK